MSDLSLPVGTHVIVTGDSMGFSHGFAPGTPGVITGHGSTSYRVDSRNICDVIDAWFVHPNDIKELTSMPNNETYPPGVLNPDVKGFMRTDGTPIIDVEQRKAALAWAIEQGPEETFADLVKLANWVLTGEYR